MKQILRIVILLLVVSSCQKIEIPENSNQPDLTNIFEIEAPEDFDYSTTKKIKLTLKAVNNEGEDMVSLPVKIYIPDDNSSPEEGQEEVGGKLIGHGYITPNGTYEKEIVIDRNIENVLVYTSYLGLPAYHRIQVGGNNDRDIYYTLGEDNTSGFAGTPNDHDWTTGLAGESGRNNDTYESDGNLSVSDRNINFTYMGGYNNQGVPNYLESPDDVVPQSVLNTINSSLPEGLPVPTYNPQYITDGVSANTELLSTADVWVTFVHEGAGYRNALGFYTYNTNTPPSSPDDIDNYQIVYPNVSFQGSGGGLNTGNKVYLGQFPANTSIGYFLIPDGWDAGAQLVIPDNGGNPNKHIKYSNKDFNTFTASDFRSHNVLLNDPVNQLLLLGFEDISRPGGDNDFNDAIFYITANPFTAINTDNLAQSQSGGDDTDGDGIPDNDDQFSGDPNIAFVDYSPAQGQFGTLAFEDLWPNQGDYDMNDLVVDYNFAEMRNASNNVVRIEATFILRAMGAGLRNGFAFELPIPNSDVLSVTGNNLSSGYAQLNPNGTEANQANAVIIVFENGFDLINNPSGGFMNTEPGVPSINPATFTVTIQFANPINPSLLGGAPYNPFVVAGGNREVEIHLPDMPPTTLANQGLFGTEDDDSNPSIGKYYKTATNLPWGIHLTESFNYPIEKIQVTQAYSHFAEWAITGGNNFTDWYIPNPGYREEVRIY
jgi:LruC domain-containing protein